MRWLSRLTSTAIILIVVVGAVLFLRSKVPHSESGGGFHTSVRFRDATRLAPGSPVVIAGVRVGDITGLVIEGRYARIDLVLRDGLVIPEDSFVTRRSDSLFGDNYLEIVLGDSAIALREGETIGHAEEGGSTDATLRGIARAMPKIDNALERVHTFMVTGRKWVNGSLVQTMNDVDRWVAEGRLEKPLESADQAMERFEKGATSAAESVSDAVPVVAKRLDGFDKAITSARGTIKDAKAGITDALTDARTGFDRADKTLDDMTEVVSSINEGRGNDWKGSLGRLINDPDPANTIEDFTEDAREGVAGLDRFKSWVGGRMEYNIRQKSIRYYASAEIYARKDKFYLIEFEKSALGGAPFSSLSDVPGDVAFTRRQEIAEKLRFTAQFGKRIGNLRLRAGLKDSTPGLGAEALFMNGRLRLQGDLFGSFDHTPRLKVAGALAVFRSLYMLAGVDDALNAPGSLPIRVGNTRVPDEFQELKFGRDYFLGVGLKLSDADLSTILRFYGGLVAAYALSR